MEIALRANSFNFYLTTLVKKLQLRRTFRLQYISDLHLDVQKKKDIPTIKPLAKYLAICGDLCCPGNPLFYNFLQTQSKNFDKVFFVPGNHDYDSGPMFNSEKVEKWDPVIKNICNSFKNVHYLNRNAYYLDHNVLLLGSILWSKPLPKSSGLLHPEYKNYCDHLHEHTQHVNWLESAIDTNRDKNIIVLTHFVPTFKLIEDKYKNKGDYKTSWVATDLEHVFISPVRAWICGHSHSRIQTAVNGVPCVINAYGYRNGTEANDDDTINQTIDVDLF